MWPLPFRRDLDFQTVDPRPCGESPDKTYPSLVGPLGKEQRVCVGCYFVDSIADIAVLAEPDFPLIGGFTIPAGGFRVALRDAFTVVVHQSE